MADVALHKPARSHHMLKLVPHAADFGISRPIRHQHRLNRRRTGSNVVWRWHTRSSVAADKRQALLGQSRRDRRRASVLRARAANGSRLETEAWHAKRFAMVNMFGLRLPWRAAGRSEGSAVRVANEACVLHDASYWRCMRVVGSRSAVFTLLEQTTDITAERLSARLGLGREVQCRLFESSSAAVSVVGPVRLLTCHDSNLSEGDAAVWLFVHPTALPLASTVLVAASSLLGGRSVAVTPGPTLLRFQLRGPTSHAVLTRALAHVDDTPPPPPPPTSVGSPSAAPLRQPVSGLPVWRALCALSSPSTLPSRVVLAVCVSHPTHVRPPAAGRAAIPVRPSPLLQELLTAWPPSLANRSALYAAATGAEATGSGRHSAPAAPLELLLVQEPAAATGSHSSGAAAGVRGGFGSGWDMLLPAGSGRAVWHALVQAGARVVGLKEMHALGLHADQPFVSHDTPDDLNRLQRELAEAQTQHEAPAARLTSRKPRPAATKRTKRFGPDWTVRAPSRAPPAYSEAPFRAQVPTTAPPVPEPNVKEGAGTGTTMAAAESPTAQPVALVQIVHFCRLRAAKEPTLALATALTTALASATGARPLVPADEKAAMSCMPPLPRTILPRMLLRVRLTLPRRGGARAPAFIFAAEQPAIDAWHTDLQWRGSLLTSGQGPDIQIRQAGELLGLVTDGGFSRLFGCGVAVGYCAAVPFLTLLHGPAHLSDGPANLSSRHGDGEVGGGPFSFRAAILVMVRSAHSRMLRPAIAEVILD